MAQHVVEAAGPPTEAPPSIGAHYINSNNGDIYLGNGTASVDDWLLGGGSGSTGGRIYKIGFEDDSGDTAIFFSTDGGNSFKSTLVSPSSVGVSSSLFSVQAVGDIIVNGGTL